MPTAPSLRSRRLRTALRASLVLATVLALHGAFLATVERGAEFDTPPTESLVQAELFVLPAPIALADKPAAAPPRASRAITPPAPQAPAAAEPAAAAASDGPPPSPEPQPPAQTTEAPPTPPAPAADVLETPPRPDPEGDTANLAAVGAVAVNFPKSGRIVSDTRARRGALEIDGSTVMEWQVEGGRYRASSAVRDRGGTLFLGQSSEGEIRAASGVTPVRYTEKVFLRAEVATNFQWPAGKVTFSSTDKEFPLVEGIQDRLSFLAQLALLAEAFPSYFSPGNEIAIKVAGPRDVRVYQLRVLGWENIVTPGGTFDTLKLDRVLRPGDRDTRVQLWLAPALRWLPARSFTTLPNGDTILTEYRESEFAKPSP